ncbi:transglycosylase SLT domain-containing protein [Desulfotalea psychrophila]|uniref:transglycosylase SLT domain-containing protein n=1 Tax=Desulfotalea psychrophila TaxID=84980 RepID=UPI0018E08E71|nr:transglycosylase SLT domain-containing protein [Desulfotalea psychrophila]
MASVKQPPQKARHYKRIYIRTAHAYWGLDAPVADLAGQIHAESRWQSDATSWAGAEGLSQFMPATATWWAKKAKLSAPAPTKPLWAMRAQVSYMKWLFVRAQADTPFNKLGLAQKAYNGGETWVRRDQKLALGKGLDPKSWRDVNLVNAGRSASAWRENREYPERIFYKFSPLYKKDGWGRSLCGP